MNTDEEHAWELQDAKTGEVVPTFPKQPDRDETALLIVIPSPEWDDAAMRAANKAIEDFKKAWHHLTIYAKLSHHERGRAKLGKALGNFYRKIVQDVKRSDSEWNDFVALYHGSRFFHGDSDTIKRNEGFRHAYDEIKEPKKGADPHLKAWVEGQLGIFEREGEYWWHEKRSGKSTPSLSESPAWDRTKPELLKYVEMGFRFYASLSSLPGAPLSFVELGTWETLWADLLRPHFEWAWPEFIKKHGHKARKGKGYARKDFNHHASTVENVCRNYLTEW
jgi:hypothetical protein